MYVRVEGDFEPCEECKKRGVAIFEMDEETPHPTGARWLVTEECAKRLLPDPEAQKKALELRVMFIKEDDAYRIGLHQEVK